MTEEEPRDWYAEGDAYGQRLSLARRITAMVALTVLAVPVVRVLDRGEGGPDSVAAGVEMIDIATEQTASPESAPAANTAPSVVVTIGPITTGPGAEAAPSNGSEAVNVDIALLPEITAPTEAADSPNRNGNDASFEGLPEITAPPSATAAPTGGQGDDAASASAPAAASATAADSDNEVATTTATTKPPSTTTTEAKPATTTTTAPPSYSTAEVQQFIRDAWPDGADEEMALTVAQRESGFRADAVSPTQCCLGIFQLHYEANQKFINSLGFERDDLFDAAKNVQIAYAMWQRSGWGPWSQTAH